MSKIINQEILAADIGGTSSRFAHFSFTSSGSIILQKSIWLKTAEAKSFCQLLEALGRANFSLSVENSDICVFAVAGPVERKTFSRPPLIPWTVDLEIVRSKFPMKRAVLLNDFLAQAFSCVSQIGEQAKVILQGESQSEGAKAVIGAGTGLGKAILFPVGRSEYVGAPSEGGHVNFCAESDREYEFQKFLSKKLGSGYVTFNDVVCGRGLTYIHEFLTGEELSPQEVASTFDRESETLLWAARFYGRACRNFALESLAVGGLFIAGGVAAKNPILVEHPEFEHSFKNSRTHRSVLEKIPVFLIDNEESGLWGAATFALQELTYNRERP